MAAPLRPGAPHLSRAISDSLVDEDHGVSYLRKLPAAKETTDTNYRVMENPATKNGIGPWKSVIGPLTTYSRSYYLGCLRSGERASTEIIHRPIRSAQSRTPKF